MAGAGTHRRPAFLRALRGIAGALALGALLATAAWLLALGPSAQRTAAPEARGNEPRTPAIALDTPGGEPAPSRDAAAALRELHALPETYRNTTFLTAIRDAGFVCYGVERVYGGVNDSAAWTVACYDMLAYTLRVDDMGALVVEPTVQYLDSVAPTPLPRNNVRPPR